VVLAGPFPPPEGGVSAMNKLIFDALQSADYDIFLLNSSQAKMKHQVKSPTRLINLFFQIREVLALLGYCLIRRARCIHVSLSSYHSFYKSFIFILIACALKRTIILHLHGGAFRSFYHQSPPPLKCMIRFAFRRARCVIALSESWRRFISTELNVQTGRIAILPNCYGTEFNALKARLCNSPQRPTDDSIHLLFIGALNSNKGVLDLPDICELIRCEVPGIKLTIAGAEKEPGIRARLQAKIQQKSLTDVIEMPGEIAGRTKLDAFENSDLFILPSYVENFPVSILEAMRAGLPVLATPVGAIPEIIAPGENGVLIAPGDVPAFAAAAVRLCRDTAARKAMAARNVSAALEKFNPQNYADKIKAIYERVLSC